MRVLYLALMMIMFWAQSAQAKRIALVIGNDAYSNLPAQYQLQKARNDARSTAETFEVLGFKVIKGFDLKRRDMNVKLSTFANSIDPGDEVIFFFAGHGVRIEGLNYLLPSDIPSIDSASEGLLKSEAVRVDEITDRFRKKGARLSILVLDACRTNPYEKSNGRSIGGTRGLAAMDPPEGTLVLFSAGAGQQALDRLSDDDKNPNSVFTRTFLPLVRKEGIELSRLSRLVKAKVRDLARTIDHTQTPAVYNEVIGDVFLSGKGAAKPRPVKKEVAKGADETLWRTVQTSKKASDFEFYLSKFPKGKYAAVAELKIKHLKETQVAIGIYSDKKNITRSYVPGETFKDCDDCPEMVVVPPGSFMMGSPESEKKRETNEGPVHKVTIAKKFAVGKFEITRAQFATFVNETGYDFGNHCWTLEKEKFRNRKERSYKNPGFSQDDTHPVVCVNWYDAKAYIKWLIRNTGKSYRLLTEAEWEYIARANTQTPFFWGNSLSTNQANYDGNHTYNGSLGINRKKTVSVNSFGANNFGLFNVHGNIYEWVEDCWHENYEEAPSNGKAWVKGGDCTKHVLRGGSFSDVAYTLRSASRFHANKKKRVNDFGIRIAVSLAN